MEIPLEFYNEEKARKPHPEVKTVGELIKQLKRLPSDLPLSYELANHEEADKVRCSVPNVSTGKPFLDLSDFY